MERFDREEAASSRRRKLFGFGALLLMAALLVAAIVNSFDAASDRRKAERWFVHTYDVLLHASEFREAFHAMLRDERGYLLTGDADELASYQRDSRAVLGTLVILRGLIGHSPSQAANVATLAAGTRQLIAFLNEDVARVQPGEGRHVMPLPRILESRRRVEGLLGAIARVEHEQQRLLSVRHMINEAAAARSERNGRYMAGLGAVLLLVAGAAGVSAVQSSRRHTEVLRELRQAASTDALTGLANRRIFFERLETEASRAGRTGAPLSLAIIDVDHFKRVNDLHGHPAGDEVLRIVAEVARETMRSSDIVGRIGGEEFAVAMPETGMTRARRACERLREAVAARAMLLPGGLQASITLSSGVALLRQGEGVDRLVARADAALYAAKDGGRNQVRLAA